MAEPPYFPQLTSPSTHAPVWPWYVAYAVVMAVVYLAVFGLGIVLFVTRHGVDPMRAFTLLESLLLCAVGSVLGVVYAAAPLLPKKPWAWIYHLALIGFGMTSPCCVPMSLPLLVYWLKPETKAMFGRP